MSPEFAVARGNKMSAPVELLGCIACGRGPCNGPPHCVACLLCLCPNEKGGRSDLRVRRPFFHSSSSSPTALLSFTHSLCESMAEGLDSLYKAGWLQQCNANGRWRGWAWYVCDDCKVRKALPGDARGLPHGGHAATLHTHAFCTLPRSLRRPLRLASRPSYDDHVRSRVPVNSALLLPRGAIGRLREAARLHHALLRGR